MKNKLYYIELEEQHKVALFYFIFEIFKKVTILIV